MKSLKHLWLVTKHRYRVFTNCCKVGIPFRGLVHDLSKFSPFEFFTSAKYYRGNESPINGERQANQLYSKVFNHHTGRNKHHWEYWVNYYRGDVLLLFLPHKICLEFACDMIAASKTYNGRNFKPQMVNEYWMNRNKYFLLHSSTRDYLTWLFSEYECSSFKGIKWKKTKRKYEQMFRSVEKVERYELKLHKIEREK